MTTGETVGGHSVTYEEHSPAVLQKVKDDFQHFAANCYGEQAQIGGVEDKLTSPIDQEYKDSLSLEFAPVVKGECDLDGAEEFDLDLELPVAATGTPTAPATAATLPGLPLSPPLPSPPVSVPAPTTAEGGPPMGDAMTASGLLLSDGLYITPDRLRQIDVEGTRITCGVPHDPTTATPAQAKANHRAERIAAKNFIAATPTIGPITGFRTQASNRMQTL
jgi:hypothetical protein